jgi:pilus assembly protein CpaE
MPILVEADPVAAEATRFAIGGEVEVVATQAALLRALSGSDEMLVVFGGDSDAHAAFELAAEQRTQRPALGVVLVRKRVDASVLGQALRCGVREVVKADDLEALADACRRSLALSRQVMEADGPGQPRREGPTGTVITVFSAKGGCGKSTVATNLAAALAAERPQRVCLVDLDLSFGDVGIMLQLSPEHTVADAVTMAGHVDELGVRSIMTPHPSSGLDVLLAPLEPHDAERIPATMVTDLLNQLKRMYDVVVVDTPPAFTEHVLAALDVTDHRLLLATLDIPALKNLKLTIEMLQLLGYPNVNQHVILNRADAKVGLTVADAERALPQKVACRIPSSRDVPMAANRGRPLVLDHPGHAVSAAIRGLAAHVVPTPPVETRPPAAGSKHARRVTLLRRSGASA